MTLTPDPSVEHPWDLSVEEAKRLQRVLAPRVVSADCLPGPVRLVAGVDAACLPGSDHIYGAAALFDADTGCLLEAHAVRQEVAFPYVPGLFSFRELPPVLAALQGLSRRPDLVICDSQGVAHFRRFGLASHLGLLLDLPTIGSAKKRLIGRFEPPGDERGDWSALSDEESGDVIGRVLRTQAGVRPMFVSIGHRVSLDTAAHWILRFCDPYRQPEPVRAAHDACNGLRVEHGELRCREQPGR